MLLSLAQSDPWLTAELCAEQLKMVEEWGDEGLWSPIEPRMYKATWTINIASIKSKSQGPLVFIFYFCALGDVTKFGDMH